ncbi:hypothetical protein AAU61_13510 [Desulfocarbo indianensis]|nr:hypothetical protein AAU61_13510 [Desulfocarbo indianensis]
MNLNTIGNIVAYGTGFLILIILHFNSKLGLIWRVVIATVVAMVIQALFKVLASKRAAEQKPEESQGQAQLAEDAGGADPAPVKTSDKDE